MKLIVGLGNPGKEYEKTRHNVGFMFVDLLQEKWAFAPWKVEKKFKAMVSEGSFNGEKIILAKPLTFMNESGEAAAALMSFYKCSHEDLWLVYDDIDLPLGTIRVRKEGSAGTHNGMKSVIGLLGFDDFPRLRIGIESRGEHTPKEQDLTSFVLHSFAPSEKEALEKSLMEGVASLTGLI